jgi:hypothetical protein
MKSILLFLPVILLGISCQSDTSKKMSNLAPNAHQVTAEEVLQTSSYTYVRVSAEDKDYWVAINKSEVTVGATYFWSEGVAMRDFPSKELNRTFPVIFLVQDFTDKPITISHLKPAASPTGLKPVPEKKGINVKPSTGGLTIEKLYSQRKSYEGKKVKIRGEVVKFASAIMNKNWVHIQDGTRDGSNYDLTITSRDFAKVGEVVEFEGVISLNRDFGAGYSYEVIMEDAILVSSEK